jgi:hypothetical protein
MNDQIILTLNEAAEVAGIPSGLLKLWIASGKFVPSEAPITERPKTWLYLLFAKNKRRIGGAIHCDKFIRDLVNEGESGGELRGINRVHTHNPLRGSALGDSCANEFNNSARHYPRHIVSRLSLLAQNGTFSLPRSSSVCFGLLRSNRSETL